MLLSLAHLAVAGLALTQQIDTTVPVQQGQRLAVELYGGDLDVRTWTRNAVRIEGETGSSRTGVEIVSTGGALRVRTQGHRGPPSSVDLRITAPAWMALDLSGVYADVNVAGARGPVNVETVQGSVHVTGGQGLVSLRSVEGEVTLSGASGRIDVHSVNDDVSVTDSKGEIVAESVNGEIVLQRVDASSLEATTVNGDVGYDGPIRSGGRYELSSHNGDVTIAMTPQTSATISVSTFNGEFESAFPVTLRETRKGRRFSFTIGGGSAQVSLESFQGTVRLVRPGQAAESE